MSGRSWCLTEAAVLVRVLPVEKLRDGQSDQGLPLLLRQRRTEDLEGAQAAFRQREEAANSREGLEEMLWHCVLISGHVIALGSDRRRCYSAVI